MSDAAHVTEGHHVAAPPRVRARSTTGEYLESLLVTIILALFGTSFVVQAFKIPSQSMEPTLLVGDHLLVNKFIFGGRGHVYDILLPYRLIRRGDVIVFKFPFQDHPHYVKRVIGLPGDHLKIVDQKVYVNGKVLDEPYVHHDPAAPYHPFLYNYPPANSDELLSNMQPEWTEDIFNHVTNGEIVVPPDKYFAMGDNRDNSWDSRYWGFVDRDAIMGRPVVIYWSIQGSESEYANETFGGRIVSLLSALRHLPSEARWNRVLRLVH
jgi:signal peptidase I